MATCEIEIIPDMTALNAAIEEADSLTKSFETFAEVSNCSLSLPQLPEELFRLETDDLSAGAGKITVRFYPTDGFLGFLAACRARYAEFMGVEKA